MAVLQEAQSSLNDEVIRIRRTLQDALRFNQTAYQRFTSGRTKQKRIVATAFAKRLTLHHRQLIVEPHPLLIYLSKFEPPQEPKNKVKADFPVPMSPIQRRFWNRIRNLVPDKSRCFDYETEEPDTSPPSETPFRREAGSINEAA